MDWLYLSDKQTNLLKQNNASPKRLGFGLRASGSKLQAAAAVALEAAKPKAAIVGMQFFRQHYDHDHTIMITITFTMITTMGLQQMMNSMILGPI